MVENNTGKNPKGYDNPEQWNKFENNESKETITIFDNDKKYIDSDNDNLDDINFDDLSILDENNDDVFDAEILELTEFNANKYLPVNNQNSNSNLVAEYNDINVVQLQENHKKQAKAFVSKITKFILDFNDVELSTDHKNYIKQVGNLQLQHLEDMLYLVDVNKQMLNNIIARVNTTQAEDYAIINSYNNLVSQHLKLIKELQNTYRAIPTVLKKMKADIICNQELPGQSSGDEQGLVTAEYGETQFNNQKQLLKKLVKDRENSVNSENEKT
jgi:hypothetical protein